MAVICKIVFNVKTLIHEAFGFFINRLLVYLFLVKKNKTKQKIMFWYITNGNKV